MRTTIVEEGRTFHLKFDFIHIANKLTEMNLLGSLLDGQTEVNNPLWLTYFD